ncbi:MAG: hypothetical protein SF028_07525 [Candidatus Sumerlaeia bacterium]|nr:hypothetical protein [Candidatus Sumerlaeia bacterium]
MYPTGILRGALASILTLACASAFALSGSGDSAVGSLDTVAPTPGTATVPPTGIITGEAIPYAAASDTSGIARVELWAREDSAAWAFTTQFFATPSGSFTYVPAGTGTYHFDLVAEDTLGNRSAAPSGTTGTGQGSTAFTTSVTDWSVLDQ